MSLNNPCCHKEHKQVLKEEVPVEQAQGQGGINKVKIPPMTTPTMMMQDQPTPDIVVHEGSFTKSISIMPPHFDGESYSKWKNSMRDYLIAVNPTLWDIVEVCITFPHGDDTLTQDHRIDIQRNYQALHLIKSSLCAKEFDKIDGLQSAKEVWNTLFINHQGTRRVREGRIRAFESELNRIIIRENETSQEMYNRLNKIINKIRSLGSDNSQRKPQEQREGSKCIIQGNYQGG
uniref:DUF4219 domain-containing protein n=1 Tax=Setaria italica TaxID=4555 RepID=K3Y321_SETIT